jgi:hypothetical protein
MSHHSRKKGLTKFSARKTRPRKDLERVYFLGRPPGPTESCLDGEEMRAFRVFPDGEANANAISLHVKKWDSLYETI